MDTQKKIKVDKKALKKSIAEKKKAENKPVYKDVTQVWNKKRAF